MGLAKLLRKVEQSKGNGRSWTRGTTRGFAGSCAKDFDWNDATHLKSPLEKGGRLDLGDCLVALAIFHTSRFPRRNAHPPTTMNSISPGLSSLPFSGDAWPFLIEILPSLVRRPSVP